MRAFRLVLVALLCHFCSYGQVRNILPQHAAPQLSGRTEAQVRQEFVAVLLSQDHVQEDLVRGQYRNSGPQVKAYLKAAGLPEGYPWCSAIILWAGQQVHIKFRADAFAKSYFSPRTNIWPGVAGAGPRQPGDLIGFRFGRRGKDVDHVGVNIFWGTSPMADTFQGNTSGSKASREGQGAYRKWVLKSQIHVVADLFKCLK